MDFTIDEVWIDPDVVEEPMTRHIVQGLGQAKVLEGPEAVGAMRRLLLEPDPFRKGKRVLRLLRFKGNAVRPCPGTRSYVCCGLEILHIGQGCPMDCTYCALQAYLNNPVLEVFVNTDDLYRGLRELMVQSPQRFHRICTGEFTDSLALDPLTDTAKGLVAFFSEAQNASLELKTKTDNITPLLEVDPRGRTIVSFSVNAEEISRKMELRSVPLYKRLQAASLLQDKGYKLGFHFDPIIPYPRWEDEYSETIREIASHVDAQNVVWISMGVVRFVPQLKEIVLSRFGVQPYLHDAFVRGLDGKYRLYVQRRIGVYKTLFNCIRDYLPGVRVYICMESPYVWQEALGIRMENSASLAEYLDKAVR